MVDKVDFKRNVSSAVMGDLNEAPRQSNNSYVSVNVNSEKGDEAKINPRQKAQIFGKVMELIAAKQISDTNENRLLIYGAILDQFQIHKIEDLLHKRHKDVIAMLSRWIREATDQGKTSLLDAESAPIPTLTVRQQVVSAPLSNTEGTCLACAEKGSSFIRLQRTTRIQLVALILSLAACGWLLYKSGVLATESGHAAIKDERCYIAGKSYSLGYIERQKGKVPMQCVGSTGDMPAMWLDANRGQ